MIFEFLDVKKRRIATYTDTQLLEGVARREMSERVIMDSAEVEFTLDLLKDVQDSTYVMFGDTGWFRVNPIYKISDISYNDTVKFTGVSQSLDRASGVKVILEGNPSLLSAMDNASASLGFTLDIKTDLSEEVLTYMVSQYVDIYSDEGFILSEGIEALTQILKGTSEFDTQIEDDKVAKTVLRISDNLGREYKDALIYGVNISALNVEERNEGIVTAIEYTGMSVGEGDEGVLTLDWENKSVPRIYTLPNSKRTAELVKYTENEGKVHYLLEDVKATEKYGYYTVNEERIAEPIILSLSNTNITSLEELVELSIKELDGKSTPQTQYSITANVNGLDVADNLGIQVPHLGIDRYMEVISVDYDMVGDDESNITVGVSLPTELEKRMRQLESSVLNDKDGNGNGDGSGDGGGGNEPELPVDVERGKVLNTLVLPTTVQYAGRGYSNSGLPTWVTVATDRMYVDDIDYYLEFDYKIKEGFIGAFLELGFSTSAFRNIDLVRDNGFYSSLVLLKVAEIEIEGNEGSVSVRLNDFQGFMEAAVNEDESGKSYISNGRYVYPFVSVYDGAGVAQTLNFIDKGLDIPTTEDELDRLTGYLTNFTLTANERTTRDPS